MSKPFKRQNIQETIHQPKKRMYSGNGISFDEWLRTKKTAPQADETEKETEKRKADELRQMMAQVHLNILYKVQWRVIRNYFCSFFL